MSDITVLDFSQIYEQETFYEEREVRWVDCTDIRGTNCYCDQDAMRLIKQRTSEISPEGIHFIDAGNYHYASGIWMEKIAQPFDLVLIDHHPDTQIPVFDGLISCGGWVRQFMMNNDKIRDAVLIDASPKLCETVPPHVKLLRRQEIKPGISWEKERLPIYISVDKDVLDRQWARTDWTQGTMCLVELQKILQILMKEYEVIGIDICGEETDTARTEDRIINEVSNQSLLRTIM